ncbi:hypothetical protein [Desulfotomaculum copahuensis]|uniref:Uncharacterized protein n=1 Tax=Desulfotomaculum copahuensis TaxID=1838280 RepID=A0A1B7LJE9_9FIRM|nr:hypothetical protein [Desulfotomaculum copahuensis]OAT86697.1 hypothetical protein A6M21_02420 [Desulfotomaculum copahuensis]
MGVAYSGKEDVTDSVGLLISILVRYPEVATINFDPDRQVLKFTFISSQVLVPADMGEIKEKLLDSIAVFNILENRETRLSRIDCQVCEQLTMIEVQRDVETLVQEEIALIVQLLRLQLDRHLVTDDNEPLFEEDLLIQEEIIEHMLESIRDASGDKYLFAFREEGRVLVFNK